MADVIVKTAELQLKTAKLTKSILKQMRVITYTELADLNRKFPDRSNVVGWVHGSVLGDDHSTIVIMKLEEGNYGKYEGMHESRAKYEQIYII